MSVGRSVVFVDDSHRNLVVASCRPDQARRTFGALHKTFSLFVSTLLARPLACLGRNGRKAFGRENNSITNPCLLLGALCRATRRSEKRNCSKQVSLTSNFDKTKQLRIRSHESRASCVLVMLAVLQTRASYSTATLFEERMTLIPYLGLARILTARTAYAKATSGTKPDHGRSGREDFVSISARVTT